MSLNKFTKAYKKPKKAYNSILPTMAKWTTKIFLNEVSQLKYCNTTAEYWSLAAAKSFQSDAGGCLSWEGSKNWHGLLKER